MYRKIVASFLCVSMMLTSGVVSFAENEADENSVAITEQEKNTVETERPSEETQSETPEKTDAEIIDTLKISDISLMSESNTATYPIEKEQTYSFQNVGIVSQEITGLDEYIDYVIYYKDGSVQKYAANERPYKLSVPAGGKIVITSLEYSINAVIADDYFLVEEEATPVFHKIVLKLYDTYTFANTSKVAYKVMYRWSGSSDHGYDYVLYDADGNVSNYTHNSYDYIEVPAGYSLKVTQTGSYGQELNALYDKFDVTQNTEPVMQKIVLSAGETYTFTNISNITYKVMYRWSGSSDHGYDYVLYDADGSISNYAHNSYDYIEVPAGYSLKVTQTGSYGQELNALYDKFSVTKNTEPVMQKVRLSAGETYTFTNESNAAYKVMYRFGGSSDHGYDYVLYDANGNVSNFTHNAYDYTEVPVGYSLKVTQTGPYGQELNALYDKFSVTKNTEPVMQKVRLSAGETYTFTNETNAVYKIMYRFGGSSDHGYDYVIYYSNGKVKETGSKTCAYIEVPAGGSVKITQTGIYGQELDGLYEVFDVANNSSSMPTYKIENTDTVDATMKLKSGYSYDYAIYDANNVLSSYNVNTTENVTIPKGGYAIATTNTTSSSPFEDNSSLSISDYSNAAYNVTYLNPNETYKYTNTGSRELRVYKNGLSCDYVIHNADGSINSYAKCSTADYITVPVGGDVCITSYNYIHLKGLNNYFDVEQLDNTVFEIASCTLGETYQFTNSAVKDIKLFLSDSVYDYVIYSADGSVFKEGVNCTDSSISIPSGSKFVATPLVSNISIYALKEVFSLSQRSYPVMKRVGGYFGDNMIMNNLSDENRYIYASPSNYIDYISYDAGNNAQTTKELVNPSSIEVPANGKIEMNVRASNITFCGLYEFFSDEDLTVHVNGITLSDNSITLKKGKQKMLSAFITPDDATNKTVTWSSSNPAVATVAQTGKVTAKSFGNTIITATAVDGGYTASCEVVVTDDSTISVTGVSLNKTSTNLSVGETDTLIATITPSNATNKNVTWTSSNTSVATVINGVITAKSEGNALITVKTTDGSKTATCSVTVTASSSDNKCGDNLTWNISNGVLTINGTGDMYVYGGQKAPWWSKRSEITSIVINDGVTSLTEAAFYQLENTKTITIPKTISKIGDAVFGYVNNVDTVYYNAENCSYNGKTLNYAYNYFAKGTKLIIGKSVKSIGANVFYRADFKEVVYEGSADEWANVSVTDTNNDVLKNIKFAKVSDNTVISIGTVKAMSGQEVVVPIKLSKNTGLTGLQFDCSYDAALTLTKVEKGTALNTLDFTAPGDLSAKTVTLLWDGMEADASNGDIALLTFKIADNTAVGDYTISLKIKTACDQDLNDVTVETESGSISVIKYIPGDVNSDNEVNTKDIIMIRRYIAGGYKVSIIKEAADVDANNDINAKDIIMIRRYIAGGYGVVLK